MHRLAPFAIGLVLVLLLCAPAGVAAIGVPHATVAFVAESEIARVPCPLPELLLQACAAGELSADAVSQATPVAPPGVTARTTALLVTAIHDPLRVTGSDGMVHLEYDLVLTNVFTTPVTITAIDVLTPDGQSLLRLEGDALEAMTQPLVGSTPTDLVPQSGALAAMLDVVVPPEQVPERLTHRITYDACPGCAHLTIIGSREIRRSGPDRRSLRAARHRPTLARNRLGERQRLLRCLGPSLGPPRRRWVPPRQVRDLCHRLDSARGQPRTLPVTAPATRTTSRSAPRSSPSPTARSSSSATGSRRRRPTNPRRRVHQPLDYGGNEVVLELAPGVFAFYAHLQPGSIRVQIGETVTTGQVLGLLGNTGNSTGPHLHFQLADGPDVLTATSLPFVIDAWTLAGTVAPESTATDVRVVGTPEPQTATLPLDLTVADFP